MKNVITILLILLSFNISANDWRDQWLKQDKVAHLIGSTAITCASIEIVKDCKINKHEAELIGLGMALGVGMAKEFLYDSSPSAYDLGVNIFGCIAGVYLNRWLQKVFSK
jgi:uncharacterized protein YfiM (DUF2279 family)